MTLRLTERYTGPTLLKEGFRPFFLLAAFWGIATLVVWLGFVSGSWQLSGVFTPLDWHRHELLYGYTGAIVGGFLLTAVARWTGRAPLSGAPLGALVLLWLAGRIAILVPGSLSASAIASIDLSFFVALVAWTTHELVRSRNYKNLGVLLVVSLFAFGNGVFHAEAAAGGSADIGSRIGIATLLTLILVIAGRIVPAFTRNWLIRVESAARPVPFGGGDAITIVLSGVTLALWVVTPLRGPGEASDAQSLLLAGALGASALANAWRLSRWQGYRTFTDPLVAVMHVAFAFVPAGFAAMAVASVSPGIVPVSVATHLWTAGAIALMCFAVMTRAGLGHTGQALVADRAIRGIYIALTLAALVRVAAGLGVEYPAFLLLGGFSWCLAHALYLKRYARLFATAP